jgi:hypothetical protein
MERPDLGYSEVLELIAPDAATRRDYLAQHFGGREPAATHKLLAALAERGLVRVFVTTNFDRLLEHALQARGIEPVVVTCAADLDVAPRREHSPCFVLKPHGDYLQQTIRNTPAELATLDPAITAELQEVFDRYGLVVLGYSGSDKAIAYGIRSRESRYGLYWVSRGALAEPARSLVEAAAGRVVVREDAAAFLGDLERRLVVFEAHPDGTTPVLVNDEVLHLAGRDKLIPLRELLRRERREFETRVGNLIAEHRSVAPSQAVLVECHQQLLPVLERRLATLLPLSSYSPELFAAEVDALADWISNRPPYQGYSVWSDLMDWAIWWLAYAVGAHAARSRQWPSLRPLFEAEIRVSWDPKPQPLVQSAQTDGGAASERPCSPLSATRTGSSRRGSRLSRPWPGRGC